MVVMRVQRRIGLSDGLHLVTEVGRLPVKKRVFLWWNGTFQGH